MAPRIETVDTCPNHLAVMHLKSIVQKDQCLCPPSSTGGWGLTIFAKIGECRNNWEMFFFKSRKSGNRI